MYKLQSGEEININEKPKEFIKKELSENETCPRILKTMIEAGRPLRIYEIAELSKMSKERVYRNINIMVSKGSILIKKAIDYKFYYPQLFYLDKDVLKILYGIMLPFIEVLDKNSDYTQSGIDNGEAILENVQMLLKLFQFDVDYTKNNDVENEF